MLTFTQKDRLQTILDCRFHPLSSGVMYNFQQLVDETTQSFQEKFGSEPTWVVAAPGRVNLIGEHIDYNDGFVLPMAIDRYVVIAGGPKDGDSDQATLYSLDLDDMADVPLDADSRPDGKHWSNYLRGVIAGFAELGQTIPPFNAVAHSNVPAGGGLSSSAALEVATATLLEAITGETLELTKKGLICQKAEHEFAGVPCGIMDQFSSVMCQADHVLLLDCRSQETEQVPFLNLDIAVLIINSEVKHELSSGEYGIRRQQCEQAAEQLGVDSLRDYSLELLEQNRDKLEPVIYQRAHHVVSEIARTIAAAECMKAGDWDRLGKLMYESHHSLSKDFEVSCEELDVLVELASTCEGVIGSRMTGGGFGGCTVSLVQSDHLQDVMDSIAKRYKKRTGIEATMFATRPSRGAHVVESVSS